ncbi:hypothetical protein M2650_01675 [Luteimonas sp. SX5]|uniref:Protein SirB1 N-terminal domain-containing protein n=1 Tax=Luteimonas galliterrae TaxID=2940486 RepID=A0ABT0MER7_9GAMM|nr:transglutaminase family protein [Luteimonas galliterrae]MCL1633356.1 hypothetical protein [Luteimonas galliterrae]
MRSISAYLLGVLLVFGVVDESLASSKGAPAKSTKPDPNVEELRKLLSQPEGFIDLAKAKVAIDHMVDPKVDVQGTLRLLDQWADKVRARFPPGASNKAKLNLLISTLYEPGPWNDYRPFGYDFRGPRIQALSDTFLSTYLTTRKGQCVIMPIAFVLLGQKLGLPITMSMAPHHLLGKYGDEENGTWMNIEATSGKIYWDGQFEQSPLVGLSPDWAEKGAFLRPFSQRESVALFATSTLAPFYKSKWQPERLLEVVDLVLATNPKDAVAMTYKADAYYQLIEQRFKRNYPLAEQIPPAERKQYFFYSRENLAWYEKAEALGWKQWSSEDWAKYEAHFIKQKNSQPKEGKQ